MCYSILFFGDPYEESHQAMQALWLALRVRIPRPKVGKRLAKRDIFQTQGEGILAIGEIPVLCIGACAKNLTRQCKPYGLHRGFAFAARRSESGSRSETFSRRRASEFSPQARFPYFVLVLAQKISPGNASRTACIAGSHTPPEGRKAAREARHFPDAGRGYSRHRRDSRVSIWFGTASPILFCFSINTGRHPHRMAPCCIFVFYSSDPQSDSRFVSRIPTPMNRSVRPG